MDRTPSLDAAAVRHGGFVRRPLMFLALLAQPLAAQTIDWARVTIGLSAGIQASSSLWDVADQPILSSNAPAHYPPDLFHLDRKIRSGLTVAAQATHFSSPHFGLTAEFTYLGLKLQDICVVSRDGGDAELAAACAAVGSSQHSAGQAVDQSASTTLFQAGVVVRPFKPATLQPFFKAMAGFATTPRSTVAMTSTYGAIADTALSLGIYQDYRWSQTRPVFTVAAGITTAATSGLLVNFDVRETLLTQAVVDGPTTAQYLVPANHLVVKAIPSVLLGLELVLKRDRGKRY